MPSLIGADATGRCAIADLSASLFEAFDSNKSGAVSLQEFVHGLSVCMRGSVVEQADRTMLIDRGEVC